MEATATYSFSSPEAFNFDSPKDWPRWKSRFERFRIASKLNKSTEEEQVNTLIYIMGERADEAMLTFNLSTDDSKKYTLVLGKFDNYFVPKTNVTFERARFNTRCQNFGESANEFITALYSMAENCNYGLLKDELIRDRIVVGIADKKLSEKLQLLDDLTLDKAIRSVTQAEEIKKQTDSLGQNQVNKITAMKSFKPVRTGNRADVMKSKNNIKTRQDSSKEKKCFWCGGNIHERRECPAKNAVCHSCSNKGHYARVCFRKDNVDTIYVDAEEPLFLGAIDSQVKSDEYWTATVGVDGVTVKFKIDSGSDVTALSVSRAPNKLSGCVRSLRSADGKRLSVAGTAEITLEYNDRQLKQTVYFIDNLTTPVLSKSDSVKLGLIKRIFSVNSGTVVNKNYAVTNFPKLFEGLGKMAGEYEIKLKPDAKPFAVSSPRRVPIPLIDKLKIKLDEMVADGVISAVEVPTEWCAPMVLTYKKNGDIRVCADLRFFE